MFKHLIAGFFYNLHFCVYNELVLQHYTDIESQVSQSAITFAKTQHQTSGKI